MADRIVDPFRWAAELIDNGYSVQAALRQASQLSGISRLGQLITEGRVFFGASFFSATSGDQPANNGSVDWSIVVGDNVAAADIAVDSVGTYEIFIYRSPTLSASGSSILITNINDTSSNTLLTTMFKGPTVSLVGTLLSDNLVPGGEKKDAVGSDAGGGMVLQANTTYLVRYTNRSGDGSDVSMDVRISE